MEYGMIEDLAFPVIEPDMSSEMMDRKVEEYLEKIMNPDNPVVMVQGEAVFTYRLVKNLKEKGVKTLAAVSERKATECVDKNGISIKKSIFDFVHSSAPWANARRSFSSYKRKTNFPIISITQEFLL